MCLLLFLSILRGKEHFYLSARWEYRSVYAPKAFECWIWIVKHMIYSIYVYITASRLTVNGQLIMSFLNRWENLRNRDNYTMRYSGLDADTYKQNKELQIISMIFFGRSLSYSCVTRTMNLKPSQNAFKAFHVWLFRFNCKWLWFKKKNKTKPIQKPINALFFFVPLFSFFFFFWMCCLQLLALI